MYLKTAFQASKPAINSAGSIGNSNSIPLLADKSIAMVSNKLRCPSEKRHLDLFKLNGET
tara:strand:+ start:1913 stop:2092 length:180 start_codon:yes stop_codon:yes gene_type:complete